MINSLLIILGTIISYISKLLNLGAGSTWPGNIALTFNKSFIQNILKNSSAKTILVAGTNGKTTTTKLIHHVLEQTGKKVITNESGANLLNGIASALALHCDRAGKINADYAIFEVDENALPLAIKEVNPNFVLLLNLFRDQLDRYGEINTIATKWKVAFAGLPQSSTLILNADDPLIAYLGKGLKTQTFYFGLTNKKLQQKAHQHASDSTYCPNCGTKLSYDGIYFSHLGIWECQKCKFKRPKPDESEVFDSQLLGTYNKYNLLATALLLKSLNITEASIREGFSTFIPAFGRQEIIEYDGRKIQIFLSKNPTGFIESLRTVNELNGKYLLMILNDRIPDGRDVSWIWDIDFETLLNKDQHIYVSGDRAYDMSLRLKYAHPAISHVDTYPNLGKLFENNLFNNLHTKIPEDETLYILPTYSAMLEVRKLLTGKKIL